MIILEELNVPLELKIVAYGDLKAKPYTDINPNGRAPGISFFYLLPNSYLQHIK